MKLSHTQISLQNSVILHLKKSQCYILELWLSGFRCWRRDENADTLRRVCLPYRLFEQKGQVNEQLLLSLNLANNLSFAPSTGQSFSLTVKHSDDFQLMQQSLMTLLLEIPENVRLLASQCPKLQYLALEAMRHVPAFEAFLQQEQQHVGLSYIFAVWRLAKMEQLPFSLRLTVYQRMMTESRWVMLESLYDLPVSKILLKALYKLEPEKLSNENLWQLVDLTTKPEKAKALAMCPQLKAESLSGLLELPDWLVSPGLFRLLAQILGEDQSLSAIIPPTILDAPESVRPPIRKSLSKAKNQTHLETLVYHWADRLYDNVAFPAPPFAASDPLTPIENGLALRREGRKMHNCVAGYAKQIVSGKSYFYHWQGDYPATVQLNKDREGNWSLKEYLGYANQTLPETEKIRIVKALASAFQPDGLFIQCCTIAGTRYYDYQQAEPEFQPGQRLKLRAEPDNEHDHRAVEVLTQKNQKLGYLPRYQNARVAAWLKRGLPVQATLLSDYQNGWLLRIYVPADDEKHNDQ